MTVVVPAIQPDSEPWAAWRPEDVARVLGTLDVPWCIAAGWAIELFLGEQHREHGDIEIAVPQARFAEVADALSGYELFVLTGPGEAMPIEEAADRLADTHQTWVRDPITGRWVLDVMREPSDDETWMYRRDQRIRAPYDRAIARTEDGIPFSAPEIVLLFKARRPHPKDQADFEAVLPRLGHDRREWLADALELAHPGHPWIAEARGAR